MNRTWEVTESDVGFITLCVSENDELVYVHVGYQHHPPEQLRDELAALSGGDDPRSWDGNELIREKAFWHSTLKENRNDVQA